jgi:hypothetical protein
MRLKERCRRLGHDVAPALSIPLNAAILRATLSGGVIQ